MSRVVILGAGTALDDAWAVASELFSEAQRLPLVTCDQFNFDLAPLLSAHAPGQTRVFVAMELEQAPAKAGALWRGSMAEARSDEGRNACIAMAFGGTSAPELPDFTVAFLVVSVMAALSVPAALMMPRAAAVEMSGHKM